MILLIFSTFTPVSASGLNDCHIKDLEQKQNETQNSKKIQFNAASGYAANRQNESWHVETLFSGSDEQADLLAGRYPDLEFDVDGTPWVAFYDETADSVVIMRHEGSEWVKEFDIEDSPGWCSMIAKENGSLFLAHCSGDLSKARLMGSVVEKDWLESLPIFPDRPSGYGNSVAVRSNGMLSAVFYDMKNNCISYSWFNAGNWNTEQIEIPVGGNTGLFAATSHTYNNSDNPAFTFYDDAGPAGLKFAIKNGAEWNFEKIEEGAFTGVYNSLAFFPGGNASAGYLTTDGKLRFALRQEIDWLITDVDNGSDDVSLKYDKAGKPCLAYYDDSALKIAWYNGGDWYILRADEDIEPDAFGLDLAFDPEGRPCIVFFDRNSLELKYARFSKSSPVEEPEPEPSPEPTQDPGETSPPGASGGGGGGGCFIATAAYGSYMHKDVELLREFRDECLLTGRPGKYLVECYYATSPPAAEYISNKPALKMLVRAGLAPVVFTIKNPAPAVLLIILLIAGAGIFAVKKYKYNLVIQQS